MTTPYAGTDSFPATIPLPQDLVDKRSAAVMNPCWQGCFDGARWCKNRIGPMYLATETYAYEDGTTERASNSNATYTGTDFAITVYEYDSITPYVAQTGDEIEVIAHMHKGQSGASGSGGAWGLAYQIGSGSLVAIVGAEGREAVPVDGTIPLVGRVTLGTITPGELKIYLRCRLLTASGGSVTITAPYTVIVRVWRASA